MAPITATNNIRVILDKFIDCKNPKGFDRIRPFASRVAAVLADAERTIDSKQGSQSEVRKQICNIARDARIPTEVLAKAVKKVWGKEWVGTLGLTRTKSDFVDIDPLVDGKELGTWVARLALELSLHQEVLILPGDKSK